MKERVLLVVSEPAKMKTRIGLLSLHQRELKGGKSFQIQQVNVELH
jgi:hypothetical protein